MSDSPFDQKVKDFLKRTQAELQRATRDIKEEGQRILREVNDPATQAKVRAGLKDLSTWARKTAEEVADLADVGVRKAEGALKVASDKVKDFATAPAGSPPVSPVSEAEAEAAADEATDETPLPAEEPPRTTRPGAKTIGKKSRAKGPAAARKKPTKKPLGSPKD
ncbi:MAG: transcriptional regulator [Myxococcaceae bacterium]|nr:transcriptional regulator [Myxococcaceae bacterium]